MLSVLLIATFVGNSLAAMSDLNCTYTTNGVAKYSAKAFNCANKFDDKYCEELFGGKVELDGVEERKDRCFKDGYKANSEDVKQFAISTCPRTCGYCCVTPAFNCPNKRFPRINCDLVTEMMCTNTIWKPILIDDCPNVCGFCELGSCVDKVPYCAINRAICRHPDLVQFAKEYCRRTCGYCDEIRASDCGSNAHCPNWVRNGFCTNRFFTTEQKRKYCGRECGLC
ncbi:unnamed protein product [Cylicocyclus nassatus]|uniref:ShKT domain-containing protein n=1 Tax=Cylicocyclus nassatus TaxID=53992 RepID=A0AA36H2U5_CYLNA|nr:unnamed protein product [Cylicocyclus nassatus]